LTGKDRREKSWYDFIKAIEPIEDDFKSTVSKLFTEQKKDVLSKIEEVTNADKEEQAKLWMFGRKQWEKRFRDTGKTLIKTAVMVNGSRVMDSLSGVSVSFDVDNKRAKDWIKAKVFKFAYDVNETTEKQLRKTLVDAIIDGATIPEIKTAVKEIFGFAEGFRSERIARTETIGATNYGSREAIKQSGLQCKKEWIATVDSRTRDSHAEMDGETVGLDDQYSNGLMFPGDPDGAPEEIINCRCTEGYVFPEDE
jgi:SPP1 gp7 family putative phage head morphogenesis protein